MTFKTATVFQLVNLEDFSILTEDEVTLTLNENFDETFDLLRCWNRCCCRRLES